MSGSTLPPALHPTPGSPVAATAAADPSDSEQFFSGAVAGVVRTVSRVVASLGTKTIAGTIAGLSEEVMGYPLDLVKTRMQVHTKPVSALTVFREVIAQNGVTGIFKGLGPPLAASAFVTSALFGSYSAVLAQLHTHPVIHEHSFLQLNVHNAIAGAGGGLAQAFLTCPIDVVKNRLQIEGMGHGDGGHGHAHGGGGSAFKLARHIVSSHGLRGLYLGFGPTLMRDVPGYAVFFASYESLKHLMLGDAKRGDDAEPDGGEHAGGPLAVIVAGGTAGSLYHLSTYPFDVVKTAIQTQPDTYPRMYKNTFDCYKQLVAQYGHGALIRGIGPTMVRAFPANAAGFLAYELTLRLLP